MTYSLMQGNDYIAPLATIKGYGDVLKFISGKREKYPNLASMLTTGNTDSPDKVSREAGDAAEFAPSRDVEKTLKGMSAALRAKSGNVYVGDV